METTVVVDVFSPLTFRSRMNPGANLQTLAFENSIQILKSETGPFIFKISLEIFESKEYHLKKIHFKSSET